MEIEDPWAPPLIEHDYIYNLFLTKPPPLPSWKTPDNVIHIPKYNNCVLYCIYVI